MTQKNGDDVYKKEIIKKGEDLSSPFFFVLTYLASGEAVFGRLIFGSTCGTPVGGKDSVSFCFTAPVFVGSVVCVSAGTFFLNSARSAVAFL